MYFKRQFAATIVLNNIIIRKTLEKSYDSNYLNVLFPGAVIDIKTVKNFWFIQKSKAYLKMIFSQTYY